MNRLRVIRAEKRITQFQLRLSTGIHQSKISLIENEFVTPREEEKERLAKALHVRMQEIWGSNGGEEKITSTDQKQVAGSPG